MWRYVLPAVPVLFSSTVAVAQPRALNVPVQRGVTVSITNNTGQPVVVELPGRLAPRTLAHRASASFLLQPNDSLLYTPSGNFLIHAAASYNAPRNTLSLLLTETRTVGKDTRSLFVDPRNRVFIF